MIQNRSVAVAVLSLGTTFFCFAQTSPDSKVLSLQARADVATKRIGELASSGKLGTSDETVELLRKLVEELAEIRKELKALNGKPTTPTPQKVSFSGYVQPIFNNTDQSGLGIPNDAFRFRNVRFIMLAEVDPRTQLRVTFDFATTASQTAGQLRDAWVKYKLNSTLNAVVGQQNLPLGFDIERPTAEREFVDRSRANSILFAAERTRGIILNQNLGRNWLGQIGYFNALTINDPEQVNQAPGAAGKPSGFASLHYQDSHFRAGAGVMFGQRAKYTTGATESPQTERNFLAGDATYTKGNLVVRSELFFGRDRVPQAVASPTATGHALRALQVLASYDFDKLHTLTLRYQDFDPNLSKDGDLVRGYGISLFHKFSKTSSLGFAHEVFIDPARSSLKQSRYEQNSLIFRVRF